MNDRGLFRGVMTSVALAAAVALAGCNGEDISLASNAKANKPIPEKLVAEMAEKDMDPQSPMLVRLFKQEASSRHVGLEENYTKWRRIKSEHNQTSENVRYTPT